MTGTVQGNLRSNNFGVLRLILAVLVIISHSPELIDGNRSREILTRLFGTLSFGDVAVDGFFLVSGYLIVKSFTENNSLAAYFLKRLFRILPAYLVAYWACVLILAPIVGAPRSEFSVPHLARLVARTFFLLQPHVDGAFQGLHYQNLNGPVWTIAYEFRCYVAAALLGWLGLYQARLRFLIVVTTLALVSINATAYFLHTTLRSDFLLGSIGDNVRFCSAFLMGATYFLYRETIPYHTLGALLAALLLIPLLYFQVTAEAAVTVLGAYLIFWFAFMAPKVRLPFRDQSTDISYGVYLYAWPIQNSIVWCNPNINPWALSVISIIGACLFGYLSWTIVEKPMMNRLRARRLEIAPVVADDSGKQHSASRPS